MPIAYGSGVYVFESSAFKTTSKSMSKRKGKSWLDVAWSWVRGHTKSSSKGRVHKVKAHKRKK